MGRCTPCMNNSFRNTFMIEMGNLFPQDKILQQRRSPFAGFQ